MSIKITITGEPGCGKTTVAKLLQESLQIEYYSTGAMQRQIAASKNLTTLEYNKLAESDRSIDDEIDSLTQRIGQEKERFIFDSRLAWHFMPYSLKVFVTCLPAVAAARVYGQERIGESFVSKENAMNLLRERYFSENNRFLKYYNASLNNLSNYDLVVDSSVLDAKSIAALIVNELTTDGCLLHPISLVSPRSLQPSQEIRSVSEEALESLTRHPEYQEIPVTVCRVDGNWTILDGHKRCALALKQGKTHLRCRLAGQEDEIYRSGMTFRSFVRGAVTKARIYDWEDAFGFRFQG
ncbi:cytidylate kinase family protein [Armatimonas rosea]|uniref:(d)CMP kinase n=1 Tax=Armatimonas rosea TaxID=685828 RepID=A0A7W9SVA3_ARMRO|nr:cytidylate kinase family protein [Armatimonas rosea]MBB6052854.1 putative cytidylate kinase [Armatimonas rosea]